MRRRAKSREKLERIIDFAGGAARFIDTPVKRLLIGHVFCVWASRSLRILEPSTSCCSTEVLAVWRCRFQAKCLERINEPCAPPRPH
jgi:ABC-type polysaccharide/polyol phosphate transport system ATPase subunit